MNTSIPSARVVSLVVTDHHLTARLADGRVVSNPLEWYPRLLKASAEDRQAFEISGGGYGVHWEKLDEDLSAKGIAAGIPSVEYRALVQA
jgi:hypothetical protein